MEFRKLLVRTRPVAVLSSPKVMVAPVVLGLIVKMSIPPILPEPCATLTRSVVRLKFDCVPAKLFGPPVNGETTLVPFL